MPALPLRRTFAVLVFSLLLVSQAVLAQGTAFTYQGKLSDGGIAATGQYDFQFKLFDTATVGTGTQQGSLVSVTNVTVAAGIFTVQLDFGPCASCFNGASRFLEIAVKHTSETTFTTLGPRQPINSTPYAIKSQNAAAADGLSVACVSCVTSNQIGSVNGSAVSGAIPVASVPAGSANYIQNATGQQAASNFNISGNGTAGGSLSGTIVNATTQYNIGGSRVFTADTTPNGPSNTFAGAVAGAGNTTGVHNTFFGFYAGLSNSAGGDNSFFGTQAGLNSNGFSNSFFGSFAGASNTTGSENAFFGRGAGQSNTTGNNNAFFGRSAGIANDTGTSNAFFGRSAGQSNTTGNNNAFFGDLAGSANNASANSFFGANAGFSNTSGTSNSFYGYNAGGNNTTGHDNTFLGYGAGQSNGLNDSTNLANYNTFLGSDAGQNNTTGRRNSFFGYQAGVDNTTGSFNAFFGVNAGTLHKTGTFNTFIGFNTGYATANPTGDNNTLLGYGGTVISGVSNGTAIGALAQVNASNSLVLGSINGVNGASADTNVGIGTTAPQARLDVRGDVFVGLTTPAFTGSNSVFVANDFGDSHNSFRIDAYQNDLAIVGSSNQGSSAGTSISFRTATAGAGETTHVTINSDGSVTLNALGSAGSTALCLNAANQISVCSSSLRYKTAVQPFAAGLEIVSRLRPISFTWKQSGNRDIGLGAEEVAGVEPLLTFANARGEVEGVKYGQLNIVLINAIKEQQAQIEKQRHALEQLRRETETLKELLCEDHPAVPVCHRIP